MEGGECNGPCHNVRFLLVQKARPARNIKRRERERKRERERESEKYKREKYRESASVTCFFYSRHI